MKKILSLIVGIIFGISAGYADVFSHPSIPQNIILPQLENVSCKFTQSKTIPNSTSLINSGGDFKFIKDKGVIFETKFPIQMTTSYTSDKNKSISSIITAINQKNYAYINKNFKVFYEKKSTGIWTLALKPLDTSKINSHLDYILIEGEKYINRIEINTIKTGSTKINFTECR